ncbi:helix-turn-helix transcriptional regulator [Streptomyces sp. NBC_00444]|uniref:helix-turn-helix transcriptional regulator n=1 Tax=unclassified Streptomyces TaxID=2593676 RepID=UPI003FA70C37
MDTMRPLRLAKDAMDRDWAEPSLDLDAVAAHAGYSRYHFIRAFKAAYGETPGQYLTHRRIERAEDLLRTADLTVTEICHLVGFSSLGTFSTRFKARTGLTPSEYRSKHVGQGAALIPGCYALFWAGDSGALRPEWTAIPEKRTDRRAAYGDGQEPTPTGEQSHDQGPGHHHRMDLRPAAHQGLLHREARFRGAHRPVDG